MYAPAPLPRPAFSDVVFIITLANKNRHHVSRSIKTASVRMSHYSGVARVLGLSFPLYANRQNEMAASHRLERDASVADVSSGPRNRAACVSRSRRSRG